MSNAQNSRVRLPSGLTGKQYGSLPTGLTHNQYGSLPLGNTSNQYAALPSGMASAKQTFTDGTVQQLARALYVVHTNFETQPTEAIREAIRTFGDDPDRNVILQAARCAVEALERKGFIILHSSKSQSTMTVFEQLVSLKQIRITKLEKELRKMHEADSKESSEGSMEYSSQEEYRRLYALREKLTLEVFNAEYTQDETQEAKQRLSKIKQIEESTGNPTEDTISQMKDIWKQLSQALLLQKENKNRLGPSTTFFSTPTAPKEPISRLARAECSNLNRLVLGEGELLRAFSARCRAEERYCSWLRSLHAQPPSTSANERSQQHSTSRQLDEDIDTSLFTVLCEVYTHTYPYIHITVVVVVVVVVVMYT